MFLKDIFVLVITVGLLAVSAVVISREVSWDERLNNIFLDAMSESSGVFARNLFKVSGINQI